MKQNIIFDRKVHKKHLSRAYRTNKQPFLAERSEEILDDILSGMNRVFDNVLIEKNICLQNLGGLKCKNRVTQNDEFDEANLKLSKEGFDLILSSISLHFINDVVGVLTQYRNALKGDGLFLATIFGDETLTQLKKVLASCDQKVHGGIFPRVIPMIDTENLITLMKRAGFTMPIVSKETITVNYSSLQNLLADIKEAGQSNCMVMRNKISPKKHFFQEVEHEYRKKHSTPDGMLEATFDIIVLSGIKHPSL